MSTKTDSTHTKRRRRRRTEGRGLPGLDQQAREAERRRQFGERAACVLCGEADINILEYPKARLLQAHHAAGRRHDVTVTTPVCPNCHRKLHVELLTNGMQLEPQPSLVETLVQALRGLAALFSMLGISLLNFAERLARHISGLDAWQPEWRHALGGVA